MSWRDRFWTAAGFAACYVAIVGLVLFFVSLSCGCGYGRPVCQVIDTAADACTVLRYLEKDGTVREVRVPKSELERFAKTEAARQAAAKEPPK